MALIPFPDVPALPGVPALVRSANIPPAIQIGLGAVQGILATALQSPVQWGVFDSSGNQLGASGAGSGGVLAAIGAAALAAVLGPTTPTLANDSTEYSKEMKTASFPVEQGGFANYNKVEMPGEPVVTLIIDGASSVSQRSAFLAAIDAATKSTNRYSVVTPEVTYTNQSINRYTYRRTAQQGATLLKVELSLSEIRQVSAALTMASASSLANAQNPAAQPSVNNGMAQPAAVPPSTLSNIMTSLPGLMSIF
jgi:hypothetical protein